MATTVFFEETIIDQDGKLKMDVELGRSSFYAGCAIPSGVGQDSIYLKVHGEGVIMDHATARRFVEAVMDVGRYHGLID